MPTLNEGKHPTEFLLSEANGSLSREEVTISSTAGAMVPGTVVGKMANGKYKEYSNANSAGDADAAAGILYAIVPDSASDQKAVIICRYAEVKDSLLTGIDAAGRADLAALGIVCR